MVAAQTAGRCLTSPKRSRFTFLGEQERERETIWRRQAKAGPGWCGMTRDYHGGARAGAKGRGTRGEEAVREAGGHVVFWLRRRCVRANL